MFTVEEFLQFYWYLLIADVHEYVPSMHER
jgi:hypothetical protein